MADKIKEKSIEDIVKLTGLQPNQIIKLIPEDVIVHMKMAIARNIHKEKESQKKNDREGYISDKNGLKALVEYFEMEARLITAKKVVHTKDQERQELAAIYLVNIFKVLIPDDKDIKDGNTQTAVAYIKKHKAGIYQMFGLEDPEVVKARQKKAAEKAQADGQKEKPSPANKPKLEVVKR